MTPGERGRDGAVAERGLCRAQSGPVDFLAPGWDPVRDALLSLPSLGTREAGLCCHSGRQAGVILALANSYFTILPGEPRALHRDPWVAWPPLRLECGERGGSCPLTGAGGSVLLMLGSTVSGTFPPYLGSSPLTEALAETASSGTVFCCWGPCCFGLTAVNCSSCGFSCSGGSFAKCILGLLCLPY